MSVQAMLPAAIRVAIPLNGEEELEEIRLRAGKPVELVYNDKRTLQLMKVSQQQILETLNYLSGYSLYSLEEDLKKGFFTAKGGHRIGVCGRTNTKNGGTEIKTIVDISAINIRVAHEKKGCAGELIPYIRNQNTIYNTLILAPPGVGKTTYLRDLIRILSTGDEKYSGLKVSVVDERSEIAACYRGVPQNDLGPRVDVLDDCPKVRGMKMLLRTMSPQVIAVDELGSKEEGDAVFQIIYSGSHILGTIHASSVEEIKQKECTRELFAERKIGRYILLQKSGNGKRSYKVYDKDLKLLC